MNKRTLGIAFSALAALIFVRVATAGINDSPKTLLEQWPQLFPGQLSGQIATLVAGDVLTSAKEETRSLLVSSMSYQLKSERERAAATVDLSRIAKDRREVMKELARQNPSEFLKLVISKTERDKLPISVQKDIEKVTTADASLEVIHVDDFENPKNSRYEYYLKRQKERLQYYPTKDAPHRSGTKVRVSGYQLENVLVSACCEGPTFQVLQTAPSGDTIGEQKTIVIMAKFIDTTVEPYTREQVRQAFFGDVNNWYQEVSFGKTWLAGDVMGWYQIPISSYSCNLSSILDFAIQVSDGDIYFPNYKRIVVVTPRVAGCTAGLATMGEMAIDTLDGEVMASVTWNLQNNLTDRLPFYAAVGVFIHELGHNLGLPHANSLECGNEIIGSRSECYMTEYGDRFDVMGGMNFGLGHFNAEYKNRLGWLEQSNVITAMPGPLSSIFRARITPLEVGGLGIKTLKVPTEEGTYFLEYRQPIGYDGSPRLPAPEVYNGALVHYIDNSHIFYTQSNLPTLLLDTTPSSFPWPEDDIKDSVLAQGNSFVDSLDGITLAVVEKSSEWVEVEITFPPPPPPPPPPPSSGEDLIIDSLKLSPNNPTFGRSINFKAKTKNQGTANANVIGTIWEIGRLFFNDVLYRTPRYTIGPVLTGGSIPLKFDAVPPTTYQSAGAHTVKICADVPGKINETNELNNCTSRTFIIGADKPYITAPDLYIESFKESPSKLGNGSQLSIIAKVKNQGLTTGLSTKAQLRIDENNDGSWDVVSDKTLIPLVSKQKYVLRWSKIWTAKPGVHKYEICVDVDSAIAEADENNNCVSSEFVVGGTVAPPPVAPPLAQDLSQGAKGSTVTQLQTYLANDQYMDDTPTGTYGPKTTQAINEFQEDNDLSVTGKWDAKTRAKAGELFKESTPKASPQSRIPDSQRQSLANSLNAIRELLNQLKATLQSQR